MKKVFKIIIIVELIILLTIISTICGVYLYREYINSNEKEVVANISGYASEKDLVVDMEESSYETEEEKIKTVTISAAGDCTIGWDTRYNPQKTFNTYLDSNNGDYGYYFAKVKDIFSEDDLTIINLEGTFTEYKTKTPKQYNFSAPPEYKNVLALGEVDVVSFANNHTHDFGEIGYNDTLEALESIDMPYYSYEKYLVKEVNGIKIGFFALLDIECENYENIDKAIEYLKTQNCDLIISSMHWGVEGAHKQNDAQTQMGHYMIDNGVDLVLGSHPHRLQGIEKYKDRYIIYSLGNFCFGGNTNPEYKDSMIFRQIFTFEDNELKIDDNIKIIPALVSGVRYTNNYQPIILEGKEADTTLNKVLRYSVGFEYKNEK